VKGRAATKYLSDHGAKKQSTTVYQHGDRLEFKPLPSTFGMAENIYSKGTRVWFEDKDQAWISAEVLSVSKGADDAIRLVFIDERGKVVVVLSGFSLFKLTTTFSFRKSPSTPLGRISKIVKKAFRLYEIHHFWKQLMIWPLSHI
jgi:hypothetical protein